MLNPPLYHVTTFHSTMVPHQSNTLQMCSSLSHHQVKMNRMRLRIAQRLKEAQNTCAMLTTFNEVDMRYDIPSFYTLGNCAMVIQITLLCVCISRTAFLFPP